MSDQANTGVSRRRFLIGTGAAGTIALAGCTSGDGGDGGSDGGSDGSSDGGSDGGDGGSTDGGSGDLSGEFTLSGSSTVFPLATEVAKQFEQQHSGVSINILKTGSGGGFSNHFCVGNTVGNNASRPIKPSEEDLCAENGVEYHEINVATDALTVVVNTNNDWVDCMTPDELAQIWKEDPVNNWSELDSSYPDAEINRFGAADTSGTFDYFNETIIGEEENHTTDYEATEQDNLILQGVQSDEYAIGYFGFAYYSGNQDTVKALAIDDGNGCVEPSLETAKSGEYSPLSRPLFTYPKVSALERPEVAEFFRFFTEKSADRSIVADKIGYVPKTEEAMQAELDELNSAIESVQ